MRTAPPRIAPIFRSEMQLRLLAAILLQPARQWTLPELAALLDAPVSSVHRELDRSVASGIVERDAAQRPHLFSANPDDPLYAPVALILRRTVGVETELRDALEELPIAAAAIHGSWAENAARSSSDIDLVVVGSVDLRDIRRRVRPIAKAAGRRMDVTVFGLDEFRQLLDERSGFARHLLEEETTAVIGDIRKLADR
jgi:predicted nucleotidyltransferase